MFETSNILHAWNFLFSEIWSSKWMGLDQQTEPCFWDNGSGNKLEVHWMEGQVVETQLQLHV